MNNIKTGLVHVRLQGNYPEDGERNNGCVSIKFDGDTITLKSLWEFHRGISVYNFINVLEKAFPGILRESNNILWKEGFEFPWKLDILLRDNIQNCPKHTRIRVLKEEELKHTYCAVNVNSTICEKIDILEDCVIPLKWLSTVLLSYETRSIKSEVTLTFEEKTPLTHDELEEFNYSNPHQDDEGYGLPLLPEREV